MLSAQTVLHLLSTYGYLGLFAAVFVAALGVGAPIPVTALLLTLGALSAAHGGPNLLALAAAGILAASAGHAVDYTLGRVGNRFVERLLGTVRRRASMDGLLQSALRLRGGLALLMFVSRFLLTPIASPVSLLAGVARMRVGRYLAVELVGSAIYVLGNLTLGRVFGPHLLAQGGAIPTFWVVVAVASLLPLVLVRVVTLVLARVRDSSATAATATRVTPSESSSVRP